MATGPGKVSHTRAALIVAIDEQERAILRDSSSGALVEVRAPSGIGEIAATGMAARVYLDSEERLVGWALSDENVGVREDYRRPRRSRG